MTRPTPGPPISLGIEFGVPYPGRWSRMRVAPDIDPAEAAALCGRAASVGPGVCRAAAGGAMSDSDPPFQPMEPSPAAFEYAALDPEQAEQVRASAARIHGYVKRAYRDIGLELLVVKGVLGHGYFGRWLDAEFGWGATTAENLMRAARWLDGKNAKFADLPMSLVCLLASHSTPQVVRDRAEACVDRGERFTLKDLRQWVDETTGEPAPVEGPNLDRATGLALISRLVRRTSDEDLAPVSENVVLVVSGGPPPTSPDEAVNLPEFVANRVHTASFAMMCEESLRKFDNAAEAMGFQTDYILLDLAASDASLLSQLHHRIERHKESMARKEELLHRELAKLESDASSSSR